MNHHDKDCPTRLKKRGADRDGEKQFGSWLRANTPNPLRRTIIRVTGFDEDLDEQESDSEESTKGSVGKEGADGELIPNNVSTLPLAVSGIGVGFAAVQLGSTDGASAGSSGQGSEDPKELSEAVECNDRELSKSDKDEGDGMKGNESLLANSAQLFKSFFNPSGLTSGFVMGSKVETPRRVVSKHGQLQKRQKEPKAGRKLVLVKRATRDSDEDMEDVEGSNKRRAICGIDESAEAVD